MATRIFRRTDISLPKKNLPVLKCQNWRPTIASGNSTKKLWKMTHQYVFFPSSMVIFHSYANLQKGIPKKKWAPRWDESRDAGYVYLCGIALKLEIYRRLLHFGIIPRVSVKCWTQTSEFVFWILCWETLTWLCLLFDLGFLKPKRRAIEDSGIPKISIQHDTVHNLSRFASRVR